VTSQAKPAAGPAGEQAAAEPQDADGATAPTPVDATHTGAMSTAAIAHGAKRGLIWSQLGTIVLKVGRVWCGC
jgi:hypothetical protein